MNFGTTNIHCINLDRRPDRWAEFQRQSAKAGFVAHRKSAVDGKLLSDEDLLALQKQIAPQHKELLLFDDKGFSNPRAVLGCYLSHMQVLRDFVNGPPATPNDIVVIFEDDTVFTNDSKDFEDWNKIFHNEVLGRDWDILTMCVNHLNYGLFHPQTGWCPTRKEEGWPSNEPMRLIQFPRCEISCLGGYIVSRNGAKKILSTALALPKPVDHHVYGDKAGGITRNLMIVPTPVIFQAHDSEIRPL